MRNLPEPVYNLDLVYMVYAGAQSAVNTEDCVVNDDTEREKVEHVGEIMPNGRRAVLPRTLEVKPISLSSQLCVGDIVNRILASDIRSVTARRLGFLKQCTSYSDIYRATIPSTCYRLESLFCIMHHSPFGEGREWRLT